MEEAVDTKRLNLVQASPGRMVRGVLWPIRKRAHQSGKASAQKDSTEEQHVQRSHLITHHDLSESEEDQHASTEGCRVILYLAMICQVVVAPTPVHL